MVNLYSTTCTFVLLYFEGTQEVVSVGRYDFSSVDNTLTSLNHAFGRRYTLYRFVLDLFGYVRFVGNISLEKVRYIHALEQGRTNAVGGFP